MTPKQADEALSRRATVRAFYAPFPYDTRVEGVIVGYTTEPTVIIARPDGTNEHWLMRLTEVREWSAVLPWSTP